MNLYSYHIFYFPFRWSLPADANKPFSMQANLDHIPVNSFSMWERIQLDKQNPCPPRTEQDLEEAKEMFGEQQYYFDFVHPVLYDMKGAVCPLIHHYERREPKSKEVFYKTMTDAVSVFGVNSVRSALIVGLDKKENIVSEVRRMAENGIIPCMKHLPGHGRATVDPHLHLPHINQTIEELKADFLPFQVNADTCPMGMTAHIVIPSIDSALPVTQSAKGIQTLIRGIIGFDGFLLSDAIDMRALQGTLAEKTKSVLRAGCDAVCYCGGEVEELQAVLESTPVLTDDSLWRLNECLDIVNQNPKEMDILDLLRAEYDRLASKAQVPIEDYDAVEVLNQMKNKDK